MHKRQLNLQWYHTFTRSNGYKKDDEESEIYRMYALINQMACSALIKKNNELKRSVN